jgi:quinol monooxygenase YgiN
MSPPDDCTATIRGCDSAIPSLYTLIIDITNIHITKVSTTIMPVTSIGIFKFKEEEDKTKLLEALKPLVEYALANEPEIMDYSFYQDSEDPKSLMAVEVFASEEAMEKHSSTETFKTFLGVFLPMLEAKEITVTQSISKTGEIVAGFGPRY